MDAVAHAIADPVRREILEALRERPLAAGDIAARFTVSRPAISRHLRVLRESGLVVDRIDGRHRVYSIDTGPLGPLVEWITGLDRAGAWERRLDALDTEVRRTRRDRRAAPTDRSGRRAAADQEEIA
ncbi:metalloregulator ArsR/SmtB family transcription factor [Polymorphospora sp. NPDC050346]|uniref:metalloregulator ArsR/SmtB family transcription factor n=1 Tax=Polymorphospora sp. NPDC050346 TaxID=3155780 RepID=UPI0033E04DFD